METNPASGNPAIDASAPSDWETLDARGAGVLSLVKAARQHGVARSPESIARTKALVMAELASTPAPDELGTPPPPARVLLFGPGEWLRLAAVCAVGFGLGALWVAADGTPKSSVAPAATIASVAPEPSAPSAGFGPAPMIVPVSNPTVARPATQGPAYEARQFVLLQQLQVGALIEADDSELARLQSLERNLIPEPTTAQSLTASERAAVVAYREGETALGALRADAAREHFLAARRAAPGTTMAHLALLRLASLELAADGNAEAARATYAQALAEYDHTVGAAEWRPALEALAGR